MSIALRYRAAGIGAFAAAGVIVLVTALVVLAGTLPEFPLAAEIQAAQRHLHEQLIVAVERAVSPGLAGSAGLAAVSYLYGIVHAAGPGHGKAVLTTYLLTYGTAVRRGLMLSLASALCQGLCAILLVTTVTRILDWSAARMQTATAIMESASFALVALVGLFLMGRSVRLLRRHVGISLPPRLAGEPICTCGHQHAPDHHAIMKTQSWREALAVILAIGARPCTGAILVLLATHAFDKPILGIASVLAMSLGTATAVGLLAGIAICARGTALRFTTAASSIWAFRLSACFGFAGGAAIFALGMILAEGAMEVPQHPLF